MSEPKTLRHRWGLFRNQQLSENYENIELRRSSAQNGDDRPKEQNAGAQKPFRPHTAENILNILGVPLLVVDGDLKLLSFTSAATALFNVTASDFGRPLVEITRRFADEDLLLDAQTVVAHRMSICRDVNTDNGACFKLSLLPYRSENTDVQGLVITFADISGMKAAEREFDTAWAFSNSIIDTIHESLVVLDEKLRIVSATPRFYRSFAVHPRDAVGESLPNLRGRCLDVPAFHSFLDRIAAGDYAAE